MKSAILITVLTALSLLSSTADAAGGAGPCLATCILGDTRIGLTMNEGQPIETIDWINLAGNVTGFSLFTKIYTSYASGYTQSGVPGFFVSYIWGPRPGRMFKTHKLRSKEIMLCIPIVNCYPLIALPCEAYNGHTLSEIVEKESLVRVNNRFVP